VITAFVVSTKISSLSSTYANREDTLFDMTKNPFTLSFT